MRFSAMLTGLSCAVLLALSALPARADDWNKWRPVEPELLASKTPVVEKDADAEAIFWEVRIADDTADLVFYHYVRIKIFTERGKQSQSTIDIPYLGGHRIADIAGRTIKPDGTILELKKDAVFERTIVKFGRRKIRAKSFAMPGVEPGVVIEYRWREVRPGVSANYVRLQFQRDIPARLIKYYLRPFAYSNLGMRTMGFHVQTPPFTREGGYYSTQVTNVPAFREEPDMPPEDQVRPWMLVYYAPDRKTTPAEYWLGFGKGIHEAGKDLLKVNDEVKRAAAEATAGAATPADKLAALFRFCREKIRNVDDDASGLTDADREKIKENKNPSDTLKRGMGTSGDIDRLFGALARAAGFDARLAMVADRSDIFFDPNFPDDYFMRSILIAVQVDGQWRFFDAGSSYVPHDMLAWRFEGQQALIGDPKALQFMRTPISKAERSLEKRTANLRLTADGTLEGEVRIEYSGHLGIEKKEENDDASPEQRQQNLLDLMKEMMSTAEVADVRVENVTDYDKPFAYSFRVRVPGYAQRTGKRLFFQPAFFQRGVAARFPTSARTHAIYFHYPWAESDVVRIELPEGYALDAAEAPGSFNIDRVGRYEIKILALDGGRAIEYRRDFQFGLNDMILFPRESYAGLKRIFDTLLERDNHTLTLKQTATP